MTPCPPVEELSRQIALGDPGPLAEHLGECAACRSEWEDAASLKSLIRDLPDLVPEGPVVPRMRERVLEAAETLALRRRIRRAGTWAGFVAAAAAIVFVTVSPLRSQGGGTAHLSHATLLSAPGTVFERTTTGPSEVVRLDSGSLHVDVTPLRAEERFLVHAGDSEVEVRGTSFDVTVTDGRLASVSVTYGRVEVRVPHAAPVFLAAGQVWSRAGETLAVPAPSPEPAVPSASAPSEKKSAPSAPRLAPSAVLASPPAAVPSELGPVAPGVPGFLPAPAVPSEPAPLLPKPSPAVPATAVPPPVPQKIEPGPSHEDERRERLEERRDRNEPRRR